MVSLNVSDLGADQLGHYFLRPNVIHLGSATFPLRSDFVVFGN